MLGLVRDPVGTLERLGRDAGGRVLRLNLGLFRPYLVTRPEDIQYVLRDNAGNYLRDGMMWAPLRRLFGNGIASEGPVWAARRRLVQPLLSGKHIQATVSTMATAVESAVEDLRARVGIPLDAGREMTRIVQRALIAAFFGGRISTTDADRLGGAIATAFTSLGARMLLPFMPDAVPLPGDGAFRRAVRTVDEVMLPLVRQSTVDGNDVVSVLARAQDENGDPLDERAVRDDVVAMFVAGSETTAVALTWLWVVLDRHPEVAGRLAAEVDAGTDRRYTSMVLRELLRLYPVGWLIPRTARQADTIAGVTVGAGATVLLSPLLTHRSPALWEHPDRFDPERFSPGRLPARHRFAYFPFSGGPHGCLGSHLFTVEAELVIAAMLRRYRTVLYGQKRIGRRAAVTLRPRPRVSVILRPRPNSH